MTSRNENNRLFTRAFTIVEVMVATLILGMTVASCLMALRLVFSQVETVRNNMLASQILQSEMENLRLMSWDLIQELENGSFDLDEKLEETQARHFQRRIYVRDIQSELREVSVEVEWTGLNGVTATRRYSTNFSRNGLSDYDYRAFR